MRRAATCVAQSSFEELLQYAPSCPSRSSCRMRTRCSPNLGFDQRALGCITSPVATALPVHRARLLATPLAGAYPWTKTAVDHVLTAPGRSDADRTAILQDTAAKLLGITIQA